MSMASMDCRAVSRAWVPVLMYPDVPANAGRIPMTVGSALMTARATAAWARTCVRRLATSLAKGPTNPKARSNVDARSVMGASAKTAAVIAECVADSAGAEYAGRTASRT